MGKELRESVGKGTVIVTLVCVDPQAMFVIMNLIQNLPQQKLPLSTSVISFMTTLSIGHFAPAALYFLFSNTTSLSILKLFPLPENSLSSDDSLLHMKI